MCQLSRKNPLPVFDISPYLQWRAAQSVFWRKSAADGNPSEVEWSGENMEMDSGLRDLCCAVAKSLEETGALMLRDPRCPAEPCDQFVTMMERYFEQEDRMKATEARPELNYQVGVTPEGIEVPRSLWDERIRASIAEVDEADRPHLPQGPDLKWRYFWPIGDSAQERVVPAAFPDWSCVMDRWGSSLMEALEVAAEMVAIGFGLPRTAFVSLMSRGHHLLAPTGSDLGRHERVGAVFAGYHYDLNFLTIHGRTRFPGLNIWKRNGCKVAVAIPPGCLLLQSGKQMEWLTGGRCQAGMHEVVVNEDTLKAVAMAKQDGRSLWRISSTAFGHIRGDVVLKPLGQFGECERASDYPPTRAEEYVAAEVKAIKLH